MTIKTAKGTPDFVFGIARIGKTFYIGFWIFVAIKFR